MYIVKREILIIALFLINNAVWAQGGVNYVKNSGFDQINNNQPSQWTVKGTVKSQQVSGVWHRLTARFNSRDQKVAGIFIEVKTRSMGSVWIDNFKSPQVLIKNGSFETEDSASGLASWSGLNGTTSFIDSTRASDGRKSIRITHINDAVPMSLIWQDFPVQPRHDYEVSFDIFLGDDFQGEARVLIYDGLHNSCIMNNFGETSTDALVELRDRCGTYNVNLMATKEFPTQISQDVDVKSNINLQVGVDINNKTFRGEIAFLVEDIGTGKVIKETTLRKTLDEWQNLRMFLQTETDKLRVRLIAKGEGCFQVDNIVVSSPEILPPAQIVKWLPASDNFIIPPLVKVKVESSSSGEAMLGGLLLLDKDLGAYDVEVEMTTDVEKASVRIVIAAKEAVAGKSNESYSLTVNRHGIVIKAGTESGAFYGIMTLLQLLDKPKCQPIALACEITDWPDMPLRGVLYGDPEQAARWKMNTLMYSTGMPTTIGKREKLREFLASCRRLNLTVIPYFMSLFGGYHVEPFNPNLATGVWVQGEKLTLRGTEPAFLFNRYVIRTKLTDVTLTSVDGKKRYILGKDYQVIDGDMAYPYNQTDPKPFGVVRLPGSTISDGSVVLAGYDYVSYYRNSTNRKESHVAYCPVEPEVKKITGDYIKNLVKEYQFVFFNPSHCLEEFRPIEAQLETDSRCIKSGHRPIELLTEDVCMQDRAAKSANPNARIVQWVGHVNDYSRQASRQLPKDVLINIWAYDANWPVAYGRGAVTYWSKLGFQTSVMSWNNLRNVRGWAQVVMEAREKGYPCLGMIDSCWGGVPNPTGGMKETAIVSWKFPRKEGENGFISLPKSETVDLTEKQE